MTLTNGLAFDSDRFGEVGMPLIRIRDLMTGDPSTCFDGEVPEEAVVEPGDVLVGMDGDFEVVRWAGERAALNQRVCRLRTKPTMDLRYLFYLLPLPLQFINDTIYYTTVKHLSSVELLDERIPLPPIRTQRRIADFLDRETARIDELGRTKKSLLRTLKEKEQALIDARTGASRLTHALDSGVDDLPNHAQVGRLMHLTHDSRPIMYGIVLPGPDVEEGVPLIKGGNVERGALRLTDLARTAEDIERKHRRSRVQAGDIVFSIRGSAGAARQVPPDLAGANVTQDVARISPRHEIDSLWLLYALKSTAVLAQLEAGMVGATIRGINIRDLKRVRLLVPPRSEQSRIADALWQVLHRIESLRFTIARQLGLLANHRQALITAAVTGELDVREAS